MTTETHSTDEFKFRVSGEAGLMTFAELDEFIKEKFEHEINSIERRLVEVFDRRIHDPSNQSIGKMQAGDVLIKFR